MDFKHTPDPLLPPGTCRCRRVPGYQKKKKFNVPTTPQKFSSNIFLSIFSHVSDVQRSSLVALWHTIERDQGSNSGGREKFSICCFMIVITLRINSLLCKVFELIHYVWLSLKLNDLIAGHKDIEQKNILLTELSHFNLTGQIFVWSQGPGLSPINKKILRILTKFSDF